MNSEQVQILNEINSNIVKTRLTPFTAFRNGVLGGLGAALGATIVLAIIVGILSQLVSVPVVGQYIKQVIEVVEQN